MATQTVNIGSGLDAEDYDAFYALLQSANSGAWNPGDDIVGIWNFAEQKTFSARSDYDNSFAVAYNSITLQTLESVAHKGIPGNGVVFDTTANGLIRHTGDYSMTFQDIELRSTTTEAAPLVCDSTVPTSVTIRRCIFSGTIHDSTSTLTNFALFECSADSLDVVIVESLFHNFGTSNPAGIPSAISVGEVNSFLFQNCVIDNIPEGQGIWGRNATGPLTTDNVNITRCGKGAVALAFSGRGWTGDKCLADDDTIDTVSGVNITNTIINASATDEYENPDSGNYLIKLAAQSIGFGNVLGTANDVHIDIAWNDRTEGSPVDWDTGIFKSDYLPPDPPGEGVVGSRFLTRRF